MDVAKRSIKRKQQSPFSRLLQNESIQRPKNRFYKQGAKQKNATPLMNIHIPDKCPIMYVQNV
uniref:Uncharacterized protein n=1 Tax=Anguilla anguilla TaxID=7936 RepID=A0A0E9UU61_ANGAN